MMRFGEKRGVECELSNGLTAWLENLGMGLLRCHQANELLAKPFALLSNMVRVFLSSRSLLKLERLRMCLAVSQNDVGCCHS